MVARRVRTEGIARISELLLRIGIHDAPRPRATGLTERYRERERARGSALAGDHRLFHMPELGATVAHRNSISDRLPIVVMRCHAEPDPLGLHIGIETGN